MSTPTNGSRVTAGLPNMSDETRGNAIERRANALGIYTARELERATQRVDRLVRRNLISEAFKDEATPTTYQRLEDALALLEEETGHTDPAGDEVEFRLSGDFGVDVVVKGPVSDMDALEAAVTRLIRELKG